MGIQNYYQIATDISLNARTLSGAIMVIFKTRLRKRGRLTKHGRKLTEYERKRYGKSAMLIYETSTGEPIYPIGYVQCKKPMHKKRSICSYSPEGREGLHDNLRIDTYLLSKLMKQPRKGQSLEYADNRISKFSEQWGRCAVTGEEFCDVDEIHCHHITPRYKGGTDKYDNLILVTKQVHRLIHATQIRTIRHYVRILKLDEKQLAKLNKLRKLAGNAEIRAKANL